MFQCAVKLLVIARYSRLVRGLHNQSIEKVPPRKGEYIYGVAPCLAALLARRRKVHKILIKKDLLIKSCGLKKTALDKIDAYVKQNDTKFYHTQKEKLEQVSGKNAHQGIAMDVGPLEFKTFHQAQFEISKEQYTTLPIRLLLDNVHDPMNFGAILRCAYYLGVDKIITGRNNCQLSPVVSKASAGVMELIPVYSVPNMSGFLQESLAHGWDVIGTSDPSVFKQPNTPVYSCADFCLSKPSVLIIGNEGSGLSEGVKRQCTAMITIPPYRDLPVTFNSLNVAVATGVVLHSIQANKSRPSTQLNRNGPSTEHS